MRSAVVLPLLVCRSPRLGSLSTLQTLVNWYSITNRPNARIHVRAIRCQALTRNCSAIRRFLLEWMLLLPRGAMSCRRMGMACLRLCKLAPTTTHQRNATMQLAIWPIFRGHGYQTTPSRLKVAMYGTAGTFPHSGMSPSILARSAHPATCPTLLPCPRHRHRRVAWIAEL